MKLNSNNSVLIVVLVLVICTVPTKQYSCWTLLSWDWIRNPVWQNCYDYNGHTVGYSYASLSNCWFGDCANNNNYFNYSTLAWIATSNHGYGHYYYSSSSYYNHHWDYWYPYSLTVTVWQPCHRRCGSCNSPYSSTNCLTCQHTYDTVYLWQNVSGGNTYTRCDTTCLVRTDNVVRGQYIRNTSDLVCSLCNVTCSRC